MFRLRLLYYFPGSQSHSPDHDYRWITGNKLLRARYFALGINEAVNFCLYINCVIVQILLWRFSAQDWFCHSFSRGFVAAVSLAWPLGVVTVTSPVRGPHGDVWTSRQPPVKEGVGEQAGGVAEGFERGKDLFVWLSWLWRFRFDGDMLRVKAKAFLIDQWERSRMFSSEGLDVFFWVLTNKKGWNLKEPVRGLLKMIGW